MTEGDAMHHFGWSVIVSAACLAAMGCADKSQQTASQNADKGAALTASGFKAVPANTPERQTALRQLPPQKFVRQVRNDKVVFVYADPVNCNCLYAGNITAYSAYRARTSDKVADEQAMDTWDWSPWAFGYPGD
jgi:hypothetical protein